MDSGVKFDAAYVLIKSASVLTFLTLVILSILELCQVKTISIKNFMILSAIMLGASGFMFLEFTLHYGTSSLMTNAVKAYLGFYLFVAVVLTASFARLEHVWTAHDHGVFASSRYATTLDPELDYRMYTQFQVLMAFIIGSYAVDMVHTLVFVMLWMNQAPGGNHQYSATSTSERSSSGMKMGRRSKHEHPATYAPTRL